MTVALTTGDGYATRRVDLGDGGVWAVSDRDGMVGRANLPAGGLDLAVSPPGGSQNGQLDVVQDAVGVVVRDRSQGKIFPVDAVDGTIDGDAAVAVAADAEVALGGGTVAVLDPASGKVWARRYDRRAGLANLAGIGGKSAPVATLGASSGPGDRGAALTVTTGGTVLALSARGRLATVRPTSSGLGRPSYRDLRVRLRAAQVTSVGASVVAFDASTGALVLPGGRTVTLPDRDPAALLQQAGPAGPDVVVATSRTLFTVDLDGGEVRTLATAGTGTPAAPLVSGSCAFGAWTGAPGAVVRSCDGRQARTVSLDGARSLPQPSLHENRGAAVVNDAVSGGIWQLPDGRRIDNWQAIKPPTTQTPKRSDDDNDDVGRVPAPPRANPDLLGARPGRAATLHVLDNDSDPAGTILSIASVARADASGAKLDVAPDGQTVQIAMPADAPVVRFRYTVNDSKGLAATAAVTVVARPDGAERPPALRLGYVARTPAVAAGARLSLPVIGDWRDFDGDPPVLAEATSSVGSASTTPDGRVEFAAPLDAGIATVTYRVTDGIATTTATVNVTVLGVTSSQTAPATASPDVARGQVGQPVVIRPLDNDLAGADPTDPAARLTLAADVPQPDGTDVVTDLADGTVTLTAQRAGVFALTYLAAFGNAAYAKGTIRVDVVAAPRANEPPVAVLDTATIRGQRPVIADVLGNDFDPAGRLLVVQSAAAQDPAQLQVAIIQGKYLRVNALTPQLSSTPQLVDYVVTDGVSSPVTGQVSVGQLPELPDATPVPQDDVGTVRAGDSVTVPVLDNDIDPNGDALTLAPQVTGAPGPGRLSVTGTSGGPAGGAAYTAGNVVRYVAPTGVTSERDVSVEYVVRNAAGRQAVGTLVLTVVPPPSAARVDRPPTPPALERRVVAGDTVSIPIRTSLTDPDGDAVTLAGIASGPALGRVLGFTPSGLRYQAYPTSAGTDTFSYTVTDRYGKTAQAQLRIAVVAPGDPQPPVASDVSVTAAPGATVTVDVVARSFVSPDDKVTVLPLGQSNARVPAGATLLSPTGPIRVRAGQGLEPVVLRYTIADGLAAPSTATVRVRAAAGTNLPPIAADNEAKPVAGRNAVTVDPLARASDPDGVPGSPSSLRVVRVFDAAATVAAGRITLPVLDRPQVVPYEIADGGGAAATAVIFVPARGAGLPAARPGARIDIDTDATMRIDIADYAVDPAGKPLTLTTGDQLSASPADGLRVRQDGTTGLVLTAQRGYVGPAAITFQVTDGRSLTDPAGVFGVITVPVQVGPETPVLRCPATALPVVEGGAPLALDVATLCHVWVADPATLPDLRYTATWREDPGDIQLGGFGSRTVRLAAAGGARPDSVGTVEIGVVGSSTARPARIEVVVRAAPAPSVAPVTIDGLTAGRSASVDLADYVSSRLRDKVVSIVGVQLVSGVRPAYPTSGSRVTVTPGPDAKGTIVLAVTVTDVADRTIARRHATGRITIRVLGRPDAPTGVAPGRTVLSHVAVLSWRAPADNGEPIDFYRVDWSGGSQRCAASPCTIRGLTNATPYRFVVTAHNAVGFGRGSAPSATVVPDQVPDAPTQLRTSDPRDHQLTVSWRPARVDGTPVLYYLLRRPGAAAVKVTGTSATATGLDNDASTRFQVVAVNKQGAGPAATVTGQSSGTPQYPAPPAAPQQLPAPRIDPTQYGDHQAVALSWPAIDPNGPGPVRYTVTRSAGRDDVTVCKDTRARRCTDDDVANDGTQYEYTYTAANDTGHRSGASAAASFVARGTPEGLRDFRIEPTGRDGEAVLRFDEQPVRDRSAVIHCQVESPVSRSCGDFGIDGAGAHPDQRQTVRGLPDGQVTLSLEQCNTVGACAAPVKATAVVYGQLTSPVIDDLHASGPNVNFTARWNPHGGRVRVDVRVTKDNGDVVYDKPLTPDDTDNQDHTQRYGDDVNAQYDTPISVGQLTGATVTLTVTDESGLRRAAPQPASDRVTTGGPITVRLSRHAVGCSSKAPPNCGRLHLKLDGFNSGAVRCAFAVVAGSGPRPGPEVVTTDAAGRFDGDVPQTYDSGGAVLQATCETIESPPYRWPG